MEEHGMESKGVAYVSRGTSQSLQGKVKDYFDIAIRRKWLILLMIVIGTCIGTTVAWFKKDVYRSSTVILVEQQTIPEKYVSSVVDDVASRVSTITQQVLSRTSLVKVIEEFGLYKNLIGEKGFEPAILDMRENIRVETKGRGRIEAFTISFAHENPTIAMKVTSKIASQYIEENLKLREQFVEGASDFLETELRASREELEAKEEALSQFKKKYLGELPSQLDANLRSLDRFQQDKTSTQESLTSLNNRLLLIEQAIHDYERSGAVSANSEIKVSGGSSPGRPTVDPQRTLLKKLEGDLARLSLEYTQAYPDVVILKQQISLLKEELAGRKTTGTPEPSEPETVKIFDPYLKGLVTDRNEIKLQAEELKNRVKTLTLFMDKLQTQVDRTAEREQELLSLERDYTNMQKNYQNLLSKRVNARIAENLEKRQKGERFRILDPANLPVNADGPAKWLIILAGFVMGCGVGYGLAFALEQWNPTFRRSEDAEISLGFPILATIPSFQVAYGKNSMGLLGDRLGRGHNRTDDDFDDDEEEDGGFSRAPRLLGGEVNDRGETAAHPDLSLVTRWRPDSMVSEQYRVAATRLALMSNDRASTVVLATSAMKGEGKTSSVVNLGYTLSRDLDKQTLLIGCDFKSPKLHEAMGVPASPGLADYFHGDVALDNCIHRLDPDVPLWVLPAGSVGNRTVSLSQLPQLAALISSLRSRFDYILLDAPPILPLADMNVLAGLADLLVLVVRAGVTPQEIVLKAMDILRPTVPARILLTDASSQSMPQSMPQVYGAPYTSREHV